MVQSQDSRCRPLAATAALIAVLALALGCGRSSDEALPKFPVEPAEAEFELVAQRLESALADAQAEAGSGVASKRECSYELVPPSDDQDQYEAEVTIETTTRLIKPKLPARPEPKPKIDTPEGIAAAAQETDKPAEPTPREVADQDAAKMAAESVTRHTETYRLAYKNDRWQMDKLPEEPIDRLVFEYALDY
jgi:hypothetical protein